VSPSCAGAAELIDEPAARSRGDRGAAEAIDSLLFLGRCMFELDEPQQAEQVTAQAISMGRQVLGDNAKETNGAIRAMMELKRQIGR